MPQCFVMQPFDRGVFDKRYDEILAPAIQAGGLDPYRVDRDPSVSIPIDEIEQQIRAADICLAEITVDNPNVWFELGYAIACGKEVVLVCSADRQSRFPFDVQHRHIITYRNDSPRDFRELGEKVTARIQAARLKAARLATIAVSPLKETRGLQPHEITALATVMTGGLDPESPPSAHGIQQDMTRAGYTSVAAAVAVKRLCRLGLVETIQICGYGHDDYTGFVLTEAGECWLLDNQDRLVLRREASSSMPSDLEDEDGLPF